MTLRKALSMLMTTAVVLALATTALAQATGPGTLPEGWERVEAGAGRTAAVRHKDTLSVLEVTQLDVTADDVPATLKDIAAALTKDGFQPSGKAQNVNIGGLDAVQSRFARSVLDHDFKLMLISVHHKGQLWQFSLIYRPNEKTDEAALEKDAQSFAASVIKA